MDLEVEVYGFIKRKEWEEVKIVLGMLNLPKSQKGHIGLPSTCTTCMCVLMSASDSPSCPHSSQVWRG